jgi:PhnB protein
MTTVNPYLIFNGDCGAAFQLYKSVFGGDYPFIGKFSDMPPSEGQTIDPEDADKIMHVSLPIGGTILMGSDTTKEQGAMKIGDNVSISINTDSREEADRVFNGLSAGGQVKMPMEKTFWGAYFGMFVDKFGIHWMVNYDENPQK